MKKLRYFSRFIFFIWFFSIFIWFILSINFFENYFIFYIIWIIFILLFFILTFIRVFYTMLFWSKEEKQEIRRQFMTNEEKMQEDLEIMKKELLELKKEKIK